MHPAPTDSVLLESAGNRFSAYLLVGDRLGCRSVVEELLASGVSILSLYQDIYQQSLYHVGELWEQHKISVAREHIATSIVESLLSLTFPLICNATPTGKRVVVACTCNELHQLGARMVADVLEMHGWDTHFLGANTPIDSLIHLLKELQPNLLCLSLSTQIYLSTLLATIHQVRGPFPALPIAVGGQAFRWGGTDQLTQFSGVQYVVSLTRLEEMIRP
jgi:MerR family transcriptional regulator, light-induced transcriptional regulator